MQAVVKPICDLIRSDMHSILSSRQSKSIRRRPPHDTEWTKRFSLLAPKEDDVLLILLQAIKELGGGGEEFPVPDIESVDVEWIGPKTRRSDNQWRNSMLYVHGETTCKSGIGILLQ